MITQIYPKPITYYQSPLFEGERATVVEAEPLGRKVRLLGAAPHETARIAGQLDAVYFRRFGRLRGQYMLLNNMAAIDRHGAPIKLFNDSDNDRLHYSAFSQLERYYASADFLRDRDLALDHWDSAETVGGLPILGEPHAAHNYYHFAVQLLPKIRHFIDADTMVIGVRDDCLARPFQRDLLKRTLGERRIRLAPALIKVEDPILLNEPVTDPSLGWLRQVAGLCAQKGERRIYISRRVSLVGRNHGGLQETDEFLRFLDHHSFETIDFGAGEIPIAEQIAMLSGARLVLSAHGANLTNIVFAEAGIGVIEIFPWYWPFPSHMELALRLGHPHVGLLCRHVDEAQTLRVDLAALESALQIILRETI